MKGTIGENRVFYKRLMKGLIRGMKDTKEKTDKRVVKKIEQKQAFQKIFFTILLGMLMATILIFSITYFVVKKIITEQNIELSINEFSQVQGKFEQVNEQVNILATQVMLDSVCQELVFANKGNEFNSLDVARIRKQLLVYQNLNSMVNSIYIYNSKIDRFLSTDAKCGYTSEKDFTDQGIVEILNNYEAYYSRKLFKREVISQYSNGIEKSEFLYTYVLNNVQNNRIVSAIVVNLDLDPLLSNVLNMDAMRDSHMAILNSKGESIVELRNIPEIEREIRRKPILDMIDKEKEYTEFSHEGERYFVSWIHSEKTELDYLKITKWNTLFEILLQLKKWVYIISGFIVLAVMIGAILSATSIYRLYGKMEKKKIAKSMIKPSEISKLRESFLSEFIHGGKLFGKQQLRKRFEQYGYMLKENQMFTVVLLQLEEYTNFMEVYGTDGAYDVKYGFRNIFEEIFNTEFQTIGLINRDNTMVFIVSSEADKRVTERKIEERFQEFCEKVKCFVNYKFNLIGTCEFVSIEKVPELARKLYEIREESFFYPSNMFLTYERICEEHRDNVNYQKLDAGKLVDSLRSGENVCEQYQLFTASLEGSRITEYMNAMIWLGVSVVRNFKECYILNTEQESVIHNFLEELTKCEKKIQVDQHFYEVFSSIIRIREKANMKKGITGKVDEVKAYIKEHYMNENLTLEYLSDEFGVSTNYLGRVFKKEVGMSVSEFLNNERLSYVLRELKQTDKPAKDITKACGFVSTNYFYTYFKKKMGVTPQVYRQQFLENKDK